jgi:hypothetical protein
MAGLPMIDRRQCVHWMWIRMTVWRRLAVWGNDLRQNPGAGGQPDSCLVDPKSACCGPAGSPPVARLAKTDAGCIAEEYRWKDTADNED